MFGRIVLVCHCVNLPVGLNLSARLDKFFSLSIVKPIENQTDPLQFLTSREAANLLDLPTHRIRIMIQRKELLAMKVGSHWRIPRSELTKLIALIALHPAVGESR